MAEDRETCWTLIRAAAGGSAIERERFAVRYGPVIAAYLEARWRLGGLASSIDDATQEVFLECLKPDGALGRADEERGGFRPFLYGVVRNVAARFEAGARRHRDARISAVERECIDESGDLRGVFDRAWGDAIMDLTAARLRTRAEMTGPAALRRVEVLRLRFEEDLPIREIAERFGVVPDRVHEDYKLARKEFGRALKEVVGFDLPDADAAEVDAECRALITIMQDV